LHQQVAVTAPNPQIYVSVSLTVSSGLLDIPPLTAQQLADQPFKLLRRNQSQVRRLFE
jgi:hypothetical protein